MPEYQVLNALEDEMKRGTIQELLSLHLLAPDKVAVYYNALEKCLVNGRLVFSPAWSWWAFFGGPFYYLYRKIYKPALLLMLVTVTLFFFRIPFAGSAVNVASAVAAKYLYCKKFISDLDISGYPARTRSDVILTLPKLGGCHNWAIILGALFNIFVILTSVIILLVFAGIGILADGYVREIFSLSTHPYV